MYRKFIEKILILCPAFVLVAIWFRKGIMIATAEEGIPYYNLARTYNLYSSGFYDSGLGLSGVFNIPRSLFFGVLAIIQNFGFEGWQIQAIVFLLLLSVPLMSVYYLTVELFDPKNKGLGYFAALFYLFNLFTLSQVWTRFVSSLIFLWSFLPLFTYLWIKFINSNQLKYFLFLLISTFIFSPVFVIFSPLITLWIPALIYSFSKVISDKKNRTKIAVLSIFGVVVWGTVNLWWIYPFYSSSGNVEANISFEKNFESLSDVSKYFPNSQILMLRQSYMFGENSPYFEFYHSNFTVFISRIFLLTALVGVFVVRKHKHFLFLISLGLLSWFVVKGTNQPFGNEFYKFMFEKLPMFQVYRNPYEKLGSLFLLAYSIFFAVGASWLISIITKPFKWIVFMSLVSFWVYLMLPMFNGSLFANTTYVNVPGYYEELDRIITNDKNDLRIIHLPFLHSTSTKMDWNYNGEEPSEFLFENSSVSRMNSNKHFDEFYGKLGDHSFWKENNFAKVLAVAKIGYVVLHEDYIPSDYYQENTESARSMVSNWNGVNFITRKGKLELYRNNLASNSRLYLVDKAHNASDLNALFETITSPEFNVNNDFVVLGGDEYQKMKLKIPVYEIRRVTKERYEVNVTASKSPFVIVLANNFDNRWQAKIDDSVLPKHIEVNGFANGWLVDKMGSYKVVVNYKNWPWE